MTAIKRILSSESPSPVWPDINEVLIYGAGHTGRVVAHALTANGMRIRAFLDRSAQPGQTLNGIPILTPETACDLLNIPVIIAVFNPNRSARYTDIEHALRIIGFSTVTSLERFHISRPSFLPDIYWLTAPAFYRQHEAELHAVDALWADTRSRDLYHALLCFRLTGDETHLPDADPFEEQYIPADITFPDIEHNFMDIGAFDGDTLEAFRTKGIRLNKVLAFEPDMANFTKLCHRVEKCGPYAKETILIPSGIGSACERLCFSDDASAGSSMNEVGGASIPVIAIDAAITGFSPTYIKMDIEGAEESALNGMKQTILRDRPILAISAYHRPQDLFAFPLLLKVWGYNADFHLRLYAEHTLDTVLYAVPKIKQ